MNGNDYLDQYITDRWHDPEFRAAYEEGTRLVEENVGRKLSDTPLVAELKARDRELESHKSVSREKASSERN